VRSSNAIPTYRNYTLRSYCRTLSHIRKTDDIQVINYFRRTSDCTNRFWYICDFFCV